MMSKNIKKKMIVFGLMVFGVTLVFAAKLGTVPGVMKPTTIEVAGNEVYIAEGAVISVYSLKDLKLIRQFGQEGEGPGELKVVPYYNNRIGVFPGFVLAESVDKLVYFSKEGELIKEVRKPVESGLFTPVGKNFVAKKVKRDPVEKVLFITIILYDPEMQEVKELYRQTFPQQGNGGDVRFELPADLVNFQVWDNKIFMEKSPEGFVIDVLDSEGSQLYRVKKEYEKIKITEAHKEAALKEFKEDDTIQRRIKQAGSWEILSKRFKFKYHDFLPAIQNMEIADGKIYIKTFQKKDNKDEYMVLNPEGKILHKTYIPRLHRLSLKDQMVGVKRSVIANDRLYYLQENEEEELWELHVYEMK